MDATGSRGLVVWMGGIAVASGLVLGAAWFASRAFLPQEVSSGLEATGTGPPLTGSPVSSEPTGARKPPAEPSLSGPAGPGREMDTDQSEPEQTELEETKLAASVAPEDGAEDGGTADTGRASGSDASVSGTEPGAETGDRASPGDPLPRLNEVRLEADGLAVIAGRVSPFAEVVLRLDGSEIARASADGTGAFATVANLQPSDTARVLTLAQLDGAGSEIASPDELILAPVRGGDAVVDDSGDGQVAVTGTVAVQDGSGDGSDSVQTAALEATEAGSARPSESRQVEPGAPSAPDNGGGPTGASSGSGPHAATATATETATADVGPTDMAEAASRTSPKSRTEATGPVPSRPVAILRSNEDGVQVLRSPDPQPQVMSRVALDAISYSDRGDVQLQGRAQDSARQVRIYLDNRPVAALDVDDRGGWRGDLPQVDTGIYTLRIDEVDAEGRVISRVETPFKREASEVLAAATADTESRISRVTVQSGDTLWAISRDRYGEGILYVRVFEANRSSIRDPDLIYPGQVFSLPSE